MIPEPQEKQSNLIEEIHSYCGVSWIQFLKQFAIGLSTVQGSRRFSSSCRIWRKCSPKLVVMRSARSSSSVTHKSRTAGEWPSLVGFDRDSFRDEVWKWPHAHVSQTLQYLLLVFGHVCRGVQLNCSSTPIRHFQEPSFLTWPYMI